MSRSLLILSLILCALLDMTAQAPYQFNFQAVARNIGGNPITNETVTFRLSIVQGTPEGPALFIEQQSVITNNFGLANLVVGTGIPDLGALDQLDWAAGPYYLKIELDEDGGQNYLLMGTSPLLSVPYALHSMTSEEAGPSAYDVWIGLGNVGTEQDFINSLTGPQGPVGPQGVFPNGNAAGDTPYWDGSQWVTSGNLYNNGSSVGVATSPDPSAVLDVSSTEKGVLFPRMVEAQRTGIVNPATGLLVYQTDGSAGFYYFDGNAWVELAAGGGGGGPSPDSNTLLFTIDGF